MKKLSVQKPKRGERSAVNLEHKTNCPEIFAQFGAKDCHCGAKARAAGRAEERSASHPTLATEAREAFVKLMATMPLRLRKEAAEDLKVVCRYLALEPDAVLKDRRGSHWAQRRVEPTFELTYRDGDTVTVPVEAACEVAGLNRQTLFNRLTRGGGSYSFAVEGSEPPELVTIQRKADPGAVP